MFLKWLFDKLASLFGLLFLSPVLLVVAILIKVKMPGPILFCQKRVGQYGKLFTVYKFRTMTVKAEASVASRDSEATSIASTEQCRITPLGEKLRRYKLDELPELWNVLKGDMSFVGPRPERQYYIDQLVEHAPYYYLLHNVLPGITSWGMVRYGYASTLEEMLERLRYDWLYYENMSLKLDLVVLFYTIRTILNGEGK